MMVPDDLREFDPLTDMHAREKEEERARRVDVMAEEIRLRRAAQRRADELEPASPLNVLTRRDVARMTPPQPIVPGLIYTETIATIAATGGLGKSALMIDVAACAATGLPFLGREVRQGRTLFIAGEGIAAMEQRLRAWEMARGVTYGTVTGVDFLSGVSLNAATLQSLGRLQREQRYQMIVVDTVAANVPLKNENDNTEVSAFIKAFRKEVQSAPQATGVLLHHVTENVDSRGRKSTKSRGASAFRNDSDSLVMMLGSSDEFVITTATSKGGKQRDAASITIPGLCLRTSGPHVVLTEMTKQEQVDHDAEVHRLVQLMVPGNGYTSTELQGKWGLSSNKGRYQALRTVALDLGLITKGDSIRDPYIRIK
ncbi:AAA family ATPase [Leifsonia aquatica]|uniref:AAA family ATPase n=1 Tax=Leifsonia aquatica TaxID=144185 RepID=UPI00046A0DFD|nr:AAA family ATPase [Leifsonia aquatica]